MKPIGLLGQRWAASSVRFYPSTSKDSLAQVAAVAFTILIHVWKRNMMWSIAAGTLCYMLLIRILHF
ncbi:MAG: AzlD domain-containing protein [Segatella copri]|nr:AzlD domain-containing protein [Lachnospiraceae bacterium]